MSWIDSLWVVPLVAASLGMVAVITCGTISACREILKGGWW